MAVELAAEIGCNHQGDLELACAQLRLAARSGADIVKFQKRDIDAHLDAQRLEAPYAGENSFGATYGEHRRALELDYSAHEQLAALASTEGVAYAASVWDVPSLLAIAALSPAYVKIPSPANGNRVLLEAARDDWSGAVHVSLGMTTAGELRQILEVFAGDLDRLVLYACTSSYPTDPNDLALGEITRLKALAPGLRAVGFSGHHIGYTADIAAVALGATYIERHFTDDRQRRGSDQAVSLSPDDLALLRAAIDETAASLGTKATDVLKCETAARSKLKYAGPK